MDLSCKISAVLLNYRRPDELAKVVEDLKRYPFIDDIVVWDNSVENRGVYGRFLAPALAKHDIIYTQDDDCIIGNLKEIVATFDGEHLSNGLKAEAITRYANRNHTLLGWGSVFDRRWIDFSAYLAKYGEDIILQTNADRLFTASLSNYNTIEAEVTDFPSATDRSIAMYMQPNFDQETEEAFRRWETLRNH